MLNLFIESGKSSFIVNLTLLLSFISSYDRIESNDLVLVITGLVSGLLVGLFLLTAGIYERHT
jgi:formate-dependent nitrite reductase membrane component NrfD